ncbi:MAG: transglutaminase-like domain-containing protein [Myxococcota bacterium]
MRTLILVAALTAAACSERPQTEGKPAAVAPADPAPEANPAPVANAEPSAEFEGLDAGERFYGIYMKAQGQLFKVGWMRQSTEVEGDIRLETEMYAEIVGMGTKQTVQLDETRSYDRQGELKTLSFEQKAATGSTRIDGTVSGKTLNVKVTSGGVAAEQRYPVAETLRDFVAASGLAIRGEVGATARSSRFDPSVQKQLTTEFKVLALEKRNFAGVETTTVKIESKTPELGVTETAWYDRSGTVLESRIGGFFKASLESPEVAKRIDSNEDFIKGGVVVPPEPIANPTGLERLRLELAGVEQELPQTPRQQVKRAGEKTTVTLSRDAAPTQSWSLSQKAPKSMDEFLKPTPFIQSDDAEIVRVAREVAGDATDVFTVTSRLTEYVYHAIRDEYVPAYSNAKEALTSGRGDCTEHAVLFVAMARALGIPARVAVGVAYWPPGDGFGWHAWAEVNGDGEWFAVDPTWNQPIADATHLKLAGGGPAEQSKVVMLMGQVRIVDLTSSGG